LKIVYLTPALYMAGGVERVLTLKANYFAEHFGYDITVILTEGKGKPLFYPLSDKIKIINLDINFEELWTCSFVKKIFVYLKKQKRYKQLLTEELMRLRPDITVSLLRREINVITDIPDGSKKIGELHVNRANYRNFEGFNPLKSIFSQFWSKSLLAKVQQLNRLVVLTDADKKSWPELDNVVAIPNPLAFTPPPVNKNPEKRVIAVGRYSREKGYDRLLQAWAVVQNVCPEWSLVIYGDGDKTIYERMRDELHIDSQRCIMNGRTSHVLDEYAKSSLSVCSSRYEGFGMVILEAMACGLPVISFDCPWGPGSIISDGRDGVLVENANVDALADKIIQVLSAKDYMHELAQNAIDKSKKYRLESIALKWKSLFESL
jgi:glycosyltransferase involved in cell wall biosynthesis